MFGFGKKNAENSKKLDLTAGAALEILHNTQKEILDELDAHLVSSHDATYSHAGSMYFYSGKVPIHLHFMAYVIGFINGVCQSYAVDQELQGDLVVRFVKAFDKTVKNHTKALNIPDYPKSFEDLFMERWASKEFMTDEDASSEFLLGMAEGKEWADADRLIQEDYSKLKDQAVVQNLNLNGFREYINGWKLELMVNDEAMALISMPINWTEEQIDEELRRRGLL